jgi:hypothetical protein
MRTENEREAEPKRKIKKFLLILIPAFFAVLILLVVFLVPGYVSSEKGRKAILAKINNSIDGQADFSTLSMSWWKGIRVSDISFNDRAHQILVEIKQIAAKPHYLSILMGGLSFGKTTIDEPKIQINLQDRQEASSGNSAKAVTLPIKRIDMTVNNGSLKVTGQQNETVELSQINSNVNLRPPGQRTQFDVDMAVVDEGKGSKVKAAGEITPGKKAGWTLQGTSGDLSIEVSDLDIGSLKPILTLAGVEVEAKGSLSANIKSEIKDGRVENLSGIIKGKDLDVTGEALKGDRLQSGSLDVDVKLQRQKELINIEKLEVQSDWANAKASGTVPTTFKSLAEFVQSDSAYNLKGSFKCDLATILSQMPKTFGVKEEMKITSGQLSGDVETSTKDRQKEIRGQANLVGLEGTVRGKRIVLSEPVRAEAEITSDKAGVKFNKLDVSAPSAKISCTGSSELLEYTAEVNLSKLQSELGQFIDTGQHQIAGELFSEGKVSGDKDKISAAGTSNIKNLRLSSPKGVSASEPMADIAFSVIVEPKKNIVNIESAEAKATLGQMSLNKATLPLSKEAEKSLNLPISTKVDLQKLQPFAVLLASFPKEMQLSGNAESKITVTSKKDSYRIVTDATNIKNLKVLYPEQQPFEQEQVVLSFDAEVKPLDKSIAVRKLKLESPQIKILGDFQQLSEGNKTKLQGKADLEYDWAAVSTVVSPFLPQGLRLEGQRKDNISLASEYPTGQPDKLLANLSTKGKLGFDRAHYMGLNFGPTETEIEVQNGLLKIAPFSTTVNNGQLNFAAEADFKQKPTLLKTPGQIQIVKDIQINDETTSKLLLYVNPIFANAVNVTGVANFNSEQLAIPLSGAAKNDIEVTGTFSVSNLRLQASNLLGQILSLADPSGQAQHITIHPTRFVLKNGLLKYDDMLMDIGGSPVNFEGTIGLDKSLDMRVTLPYTTAGRTAKVGEETAGRRITLPLRGSLNKPDLDMGKLLEEQLKGQLEDALMEGLGEFLK